MPRVACSLDEPVCAHAGVAVAEGAVLASLAAAERALSTYRALGLPPPLPDGALGGSPAYDVYLVDDVRDPRGPREPRDFRGARDARDPIARGAQADAPLAAAREPLASEAEAHPATIPDLPHPAAPIDRASAFTVLPARFAPSGPGDASCWGAAEIAYGIAAAIALRLDAGAEPGAIAMTASYLASVAAECAPFELAAIDDFQRAPEREIAAAPIGRADGSLLLPWFLDDAYGVGPPGTVIASLLAMAAQKTPAGACRFRNEPDVFDALRSTMRAYGKSLDEALGDFAIARAFVGSRSDGAHLAGVERFGDAGRVRFEWSIPFASLPRRVAPARPIEPTGATYLWLDLAGAPRGARIAFVADWELPVAFRWALVKVDRNGAEAGRVIAATVHGASHVERTVVGLEGLAGLLVVGVNLGSFDRSLPYDPEGSPFEPHAYEVTLYAQ